MSALRTGRNLLNLKGAFSGVNFNSKVDACVNFRKESQGFLFPLLERKKGPCPVPDESSFCSPKGRIRISRRETVCKRRLRKLAVSAFPLGKRRGNISGTKKKNFFSCKKFFSLKSSPGRFQIHFSKMRPAEKVFRPLRRATQRLCLWNPRFFEKKSSKTFMFAG